MMGNSIPGKYQGVWDKRHDMQAHVHTQTVSVRAYSSVFTLAHTFTHIRYNTFTQDHFTHTQ